MKKMICAGVFAVLLAPAIATAQAPKGLGTEEFGMSPRELVQAIEKTEELIARCMREQGFQYVAADHNTVRAAWRRTNAFQASARRSFVSRYGFGVSTFYTGLPPQLSTDYKPRPRRSRRTQCANFPRPFSADQVAYNRALFGEDVISTFAVALETEDLSRTGGCTRKAVAETFKPDQLKASHYNPQDALINKDQRMKAALGFWQREMKKAGFDYGHPDEIEPRPAEPSQHADRGRQAVGCQDVGGPESRSAETTGFRARGRGQKLQMQEEVLTPVEERIQEELFPGRCNEIDHDISFPYFHGSAAMSNLLSRPDIA